MKDFILKYCPGCGAALSGDDILNNPEVHPVGIQAAPEAVWLGGIMFVHDRPTCMTSFLVPFHMLDPVLREIDAHLKLVNSRCDHRCESTFNADPCDRDCIYARYHQFMLDLIRRREEPGIDSFFTDNLAGSTD